MIDMKYIPILSLITRPPATSTRSIIPFSLDFSFFFSSTSTSHAFYFFFRPFDSLKLFRPRYGHLSDTYLLSETNYSSGLWARLTTLIFISGGRHIHREKRRSRVCSRLVECIAVLMAFRLTDTPRIFMAWRSVSFSCPASASAKESLVIPQNTNYRCALVKATLSTLKSFKSYCLETAFAIFRFLF